LLREYTINLLETLGGGQKIADKDIIQWANKKVAAAGFKTTMASFRSKDLSNGLFLLDLMRAMEPRALNQELITPGGTPEDKNNNARYALSVARKFGAVVFITYEDIVEVKPKMIMLLVAACMAFDKGFRDIADDEEEGARMATRDAAQAAASAASGAKSLKKKKGRKKKSTATASAKTMMAIGGGAVKLKKSKAVPKQTATDSAKTIMAIEGGISKLKVVPQAKKSGASDGALAHGKLTMEVAKGKTLRHHKGPVAKTSSVERAQMLMEVSKTNKPKLKTTKKRGSTAGKKPAFPAWVLAEMGKSEGTAGAFD
jgi:hypothetical protein